MDEPLTEDQLVRLRELLDKATPGPWVCEETWPGAGLAALRGDPPEGFTVAAQLRPEDGQLIEAAVNALPVLLAQVHRLRADLGRAKGDRGVLGVEADRLRAERDDAHRDAVRENARNVKLRADLEATELEVETRGETIDRLRAALDRTPFAAEFDRLREENERVRDLALHWQTRFGGQQEGVDRLRALAPEHGSSQASGCACGAAAGLRGPEERIDAIKRLNVTTNGDDQIHVDITPLDPSPNAVNSVLLQWSLDGGWEHPPSGVSGTLGAMLHAIAVSALADNEQEETPRE